MHIKFNKFSTQKAVRGKAEDRGGRWKGARQAADSELWLRDMHKDSSFQIDRHLYVAKGERR